jgi:hypothetical protein
MLVSAKIIGAQVLFVILGKSNKKSIIYRKKAEGLHV